MVEKVGCIYPHVDGCKIFPPVAHAVGHETTNTANAAGQLAHKPETVVKSSTRLACGDCVRRASP